MSKIDFQDGGSGGHLGFSVGSFSYFVSTRCPNAHYQVLIQQDYRGDVQNMNSQHFYTLPHNSGRVLWFHVGRPWVRPSVVRPSVRFSFPDDNLSKHQWIFTKLGLCIGIVEIWFGIANGQISSIFCRSYLPETRPYFRFRTITWVNNKAFSPNLVCALILWRSGMGLLMGKFHQFLTELSARDTPIFSFLDYNLSK